MPADSELRLIRYLELSWSLVAVWVDPAQLSPTDNEKRLNCGYVAMMAFYLHVLRTRRLARNRFLVAATITLFILCTIHCFLLLVTAIMETKDLVSGDFWYSRRSYLNLEAVTNVVYVTSNSLSRFLTIPHLTNYYYPPVGRIWWLSRAARHLVGMDAAGKYYTVVAMILESGALYFTGGLVFVVLFLKADLPKAQTGIVLGQLVGIAPTIIAVRVGLGYSVESVESFIGPGSMPLAEIRFSSAPQVVDSGENHNRQPFLFFLLWYTESWNPVLVFVQAVRRARGAPDGQMAGPERSISASSNADAGHVRYPSPPRAYTFLYSNEAPPPPPLCSRGCRRGSPATAARDTSVLRSTRPRDAYAYDSAHPPLLQRRRIRVRRAAVSDPWPQIMKDEDGAKGHVKPSILPNAETALDAIALSQLLWTTRVADGANDTTTKAGGRHTKSDASCRHARTPPSLVFVKSVSESQSDLEEGERFIKREAGKQNLEERKDVKSTPVEDIDRRTSNFSDKIVWQSAGVFRIWRRAMKMMLNLPAELQDISISLLDKDDLWVLLQVSRTFRQLAQTPLLSRYNIPASQVFSGSVTLSGETCFLIPMIHRIHPILRLSIALGPSHPGVVTSSLAQVLSIPDITILGA
ncbi:hypothetical protein B0H19DRAFT_1240665 [Mycena capillaripes]|nr:hypothetical protein B0H19DRAFT_1240665 [Mycena capillaripes]